MPQCPHGYGWPTPWRAASSTSTLPPDHGGDCWAAITRRQARIGKDSRAHELCVHSSTTRRHPPALGRNTRPAFDSYSGSEKKIGPEGGLCAVCFSEETILSPAAKRNALQQGSARGKDHTSALFAHDRNFSTSLLLLLILVLTQANSRERLADAETFGFEVRHDGIIVNPAANAPHPFSCLRPELADDIRLTEPLSINHGGQCEAETEAGYRRKSDSSANVLAIRGIVERDARTQTKHPRPSTTSPDGSKPSKSTMDTINQSADPPNIDPRPAFLQ